MFKHGDVWLTTEGLLLGVNYRPKAMKEKMEKIVSSDQTGMHESVADFKKPIIQIQTKKYQIRVDELDSGDYRYASWQKTASISDIPDLVIYDGTYEF